MEPQATLPFKYEISSTSGATALSGLPLYLELAHVLGLNTAVTKLLPSRCAAPEWSDAELCINLILLNLAGGDCVTDLDLLRRDEGFQKVVRALACVGLKRRARRDKERVLEKAGPVAMAGEMTFRRFMESFHGPDQNIERVVGTASFVPEHARLKALWQVNCYLLTKLQALRPLEIMTLDADATL
ncbi:MAG: IS1380 family transposase, partial [Myxococcales bacterium]|nr:IS1380 family transposase [Myxococcales bacterium]